MKYSSYFKSSVVLGTLNRVVLFGCSLLGGFLISRMLDTAGNQDALRSLGLLALIALAVGLIPIYFLTRSRTSAVRREEQAFLEGLYRALLDGRMSAKSPGELDVKLTEDAETVVSFYQEALPTAIGSLAVMVGAGILLLREDWRVGLIFMLMNLTQLLPTVVYEKWAKQIYDNTHATEEDFDNWILEGYRGIRTLKSYCQESWFLKKLDEKSKTIIDAGCRAEKTGTVENVVYAMIDNLLRYGSYLILGAFVVCGELEAVRLPVFIVLTSYLFSSMDGVFSFRLAAFSKKSAVEKLGIRELPQRETAKTALLQASSLGGGILRDVSLTVEKGQKVLLRGANGSGKTTLLRFLLGLDIPAEGNVLLCPSVSYALQEEPRFHVPVKEIISAMDVDSVQLRIFMEGFGISEIGEMNLDELSQGQRKKFCLACALSKPGSLLVLDEPTNHVDTDSVTYLSQVLARHPGALLICTHDARLALDWTKIFRMDGGVLCEE